MNTTLNILRTLRAMPMTQTEIAKRIGVPQARICRWEAGHVPAAADDALKLQHLLSEVNSPRPVAVEEGQVGADV